MRRPVKYIMALTFIITALIFSLLWFFVLPFANEFSFLKNNLVTKEKPESKLTEILPFLWEMGQEPPAQESPEQFKKKNGENQSDQRNNFNSQQTPLFKDKEQKQPF